MRFVVLLPLANPIMKHNAAVSKNVTDEVITPTNTSPIPIDFFTPVNNCNACYCSGVPIAIILYNIPGAVVRFSAQISPGLGNQVPLPKQTVVALIIDSCSGLGLMQENNTSSPSRVDAKG